MIVNILKLKGKMVECDINYDAMARELGINRSTFYRKIANGGLGFSISDVNQMARKLSLTKDEFTAIFFTDAVS